MRNNFLIYEEMRKYLVIFEEAVTRIKNKIKFSSDIRNFFFFISHI
jgi:hypothetical protein